MALGPQQNILDLVLDTETTHQGINALVFDVFAKRDVEVIQGAACVHGCTFTTLREPTRERAWLITVSGSPAQLEAMLELAQATIRS